MSFLRTNFLTHAAETSFLAAWAKDNGISCPPAYLEKFIQTWEEKGTGPDFRSADCNLHSRQLLPKIGDAPEEKGPLDRRAAWLEAVNLSETTYLAVLTGWAAAAWLIEQEPAYFGYTSWSFEVALLKELQMTGQAGGIVNSELGIVNWEL